MKCGQNWNSNHISLTNESIPGVAVGVEVTETVVQRPQLVLAARRVPPPLRRRRVVRVAVALSPLRLLLKIGIIWSFSKRHHMVIFPKLPSYVLVSLFQPKQSITVYGHFP